MNTNPPPIPQTNNIVSTLLQAPGSMSAAIADRKKALISGVKLLLLAAVFHAIFGGAIGFFGGWSVARMDMLKIPLIGLCSLLLCYPSLYVFSSVGGAPLSFSQAFALGASCLAMGGLILVGLAPVMWLFAVSTDSAAFIMLLALFIWLIAGGFVVRYIHKLQSNSTFTRVGGIKIWFIIVVLVTMQMVTCMRPILVEVTGEDGWWTGKKMFFLQHFGSTFD